MQIPVYVEPMNSGQFRAYSPPPFNANAEGDTTDEAVSKVREQLQKEVATGKRVIMVEIPARHENPWLRIAGRLKDNPLLDEWRAEVEAYRRQCNIDAGIEYTERP